MSRNSRVAKKITELGLGKFLNIMEYKCRDRGVHFQRVGIFFASSKLCSKCGYKNDNLKTKTRWKCPECKSVHDRDINAAMNIRNEGLSLLVSGVDQNPRDCGSLSVRPVKAAGVRTARNSRV